MCKKIVTTYPCAHQEEQFQPCKDCAAHCGTADYCKDMTLEQATSDDTCIFDGCKWEEYDGIWRCCSCRKGPNRQGICKWKVKGNPCGHQFCEDCTPMMKRNQLTPETTPDSKSGGSGKGADGKGGAAGKGAAGKGAAGKGAAGKGAAMRPSSSTSSRGS